MLKPAAAQPPANWQRYRPLLDAYAHAQVNYDYRNAAALTVANGWRHDQHATELPAEAPGPPAAAGSFAAAQEVLWNYTFPPPSLVRGYFDPAQPLAQRIMVLRAQFLGFVFQFGVKVVDLVDETRPPGLGGGAPEQVWGYGYRTLQGHFEMGQINFSVHKNLATGGVSFRIEAVSKMGRIRNPFYWLGFKMFGRMLQKRFAYQALARMRALVAQTLARPQTTPAPLG